MAKTEYCIEYEHGMTVDNRNIVVEGIANLRKRLIKDYTPKKGFDEWTFVVFSNTSKYLGTMYLYGTPNNMTYRWVVNNKNNWGNYRHYMPKKGTKEKNISPKSGNLF